jgi:hypothetical protein
MNAAMDAAQQLERYYRRVLALAETDPQLQGHDTQGRGAGGYQAARPLVRGNHRNGAGRLCRQAGARGARVSDRARSDHRTAFSRVSASLCGDQLRGAPGAR